MGPLLHSLLDLEPLVTDLLVAVRPKTVLEIGVGDGHFSKVLEKCCTGIGASLISVDPKPAYVHAGTIRGKSLNAITAIRLHAEAAEAGANVTEAPRSFDVAIIDGDHNYYTVKHELELLYELNPETIFVLHDVGWPCARRDMYYAPADIPIDYRHEHSWMLGADPRHEELVPWGFRGEGQFATALKEGGPRNGVLTAVEDFMSEHREISFAGDLAPSQFTLRVVPSVFGLGILYQKDMDCLMTARVSKYCDSKGVFNNDGLLARLERNRVELFCDRLKLTFPR